MSRRSKIETLIPQPVQDILARLFREGRTVDQIKAKLDELHEAGATPETASRSAVGRFIKSKTEMFTRMRDAEEIAAKVLPSYGEEARGDLGMLAAQLIKTACYDVLSEVDVETDVDAKVKQLRTLSTAVRNAQMTSIGAHELRARIRTEAFAQAAKIAGEVARKGGVSEESIRAMEAAIHLL